MFEYTNSVHQSEDEEEIPYKLIVRTGTNKGSGTLGTVAARLHGKKKSTEFIRLQSTENNFKEGNQDEFLIHAPDVGEISGN